VRETLVRFITYNKRNREEFIKRSSYMEIMREKTRKKRVDELLVYVVEKSDK